MAFQRGRGRDGRRTRKKQCKKNLLVHLLPVLHRNTVYITLHSDILQTFIDFWLRFAPFAVNVYIYNTLLSYTHVANRTAPHRTSIYNSYLVFQSVCIHYHSFSYSNENTKQDKGIEKRYSIVQLSSKSPDSRREREREREKKDRQIFIKCLKRKKKWCASTAFYAKYFSFMCKIFITFQGVLADRNQRAQAKLFSANAMANGFIVYIFDEE